MVEMWFGGLIHLNLPHITKLTCIWPLRPNVYFHILCQPSVLRFSLDLPVSCEIRQNELVIEETK